VTAVLTVQGLVKSFGDRRVLTDANFAVHDGDRIAFVGVNGAGKSTLLRMLADEVVGDELPDAGLITRRRGLSVEYVSQEPRLDLAGTVEAELRRPGVETHEILELAAALDVPPMTATIGNLSMGERRRVALARALLARPELLALDEPTNHLDAATVDWLEERLLERSGVLLLVTHDRYFLDRVATRILEIDRGRVHTHAGGYREFLERQHERWSNESAVESKRAAFVRREIHWIRANAPARSTKQKARIDRFDAAINVDPDARSGPAMLRLATGKRLGGTILELRKVSKQLGGKTLFKDLQLVMKPGDRIGVVGRNGAGKTTLIRTIMGELAPDAGQVIIGVNTQFAFMEQSRITLDDTNTVLEEVAGDATTVTLDDGPVHVRTFLRMLLFEDSFADTKVGVLSGGERNRVQLAKLLTSGANFLILDEPTNDLDVLTLGVLEDALAGFPGCALLVSHDRWFLDKVATGILAFEGDGEVVFYEGNCSSYLAKRKLAGKPAADRPTKQAADRDRAPKAKKRSFKDQQELAGMEAAIAEAEAAVAALEVSLQDPDLYASRSAEVPAVVAALDDARAKVDALYTRWGELEAVAP